MQFCHLHFLAIMPYFRFESTDSIVFPDLYIIALNIMQSYNYVQLTWSSSAVDTTRRHSCDAAGGCFSNWITPHGDWTRSVD